MIGKLLLSFVLTVLPQFLISQNDSNSVLGQGFDIRFIDALDWDKSAKGQALVKGGSSTNLNSPPSSLSFHFVTNPYEFESKVLQTNTHDRPYLSINTGAHYIPLKADGSDKLLFVYTQKSLPTHKYFFNTTQAKPLDSAFVEDFRRLGRDITPAGFIHRYGTHYAHEVIVGGTFIRRNAIDVDDYIHSPYRQKEFQQKVIEDITARQNNQEDTTPYVDAKTSVSFIIGGDTQVDWPDSWEPSVKNNPKPIDVQLKRVSDLLRSAIIPDLEDKGIKLKTLDSIITAVSNETQENIQPLTKSVYYKKYSLQFKQAVTSIVKKSTGNEDENKTEFTGDIFFGGFSKDEAILKTQPLIELGGLRLETLITDEKVFLDRSVLITIKPDDIKDGYVSVWDDTKKLFKGNGRNRLRVSGPPEAHTTYKEALRRVVTKTVKIETIDKDIYEIEYRLSLEKQNELIKNFKAVYNYTLDSEILAAVSNGNLLRLDSLFRQNGNPRATGLIKAIIINKHPNHLLNFVLDKGALATTDDLDFLFEKENFDASKAIILLERGAKPKNNMVFKAVAYRAPNVIYALFREGATSQNNDLAFAIKRQDYKSIKALMSEDYEAFEAGKNELLLAAENNDEDLAQKFVALNATADSYILDVALQQDNTPLKNVIVPVTEPSSKTLEVVARNNNTALFSYFIGKNAEIENNKTVEIASDNNNMQIVDLALKNGGDATEALLYAIKKDNKATIEISLKNNAEPDAVFAYAAEKDDEELFNQTLQLYGGTPAIALDEAVKKNTLPMAAAALKGNAERLDPTKSIGIAVSNDNIDMVRLLVDNKANPTEGVGDAIALENIPITEYLIAQGAETTSPEYLQGAVKNENIQLSKLLLEKGDSQANDAIIEAAVSGNIEIIKYLLEKGASADKALASAMETKNEEVILLLLDKVDGPKNPEFLLSASRKGNIRVLTKLIEEGLDPTPAVDNAILYKKAKVLQLLLDKGGIPTADQFKTALEFNFLEGVALLLQEGSYASSSIFDKGESAIHIIASSYEIEDTEMLKLLLNKGASINAQNDKGETALHLAALVQEEDIALPKLLLQYGANPQLENIQGHTAIDYAIDKRIKNLLKKASKNK